MSVTGLVGKKLGMTVLYDKDRKARPVTVVLADDCVVTQIKTEEKDGYSAVQIGYGTKSKLNHPEVGHRKASGADSANLKELRISSVEDVELGSKLGVDLFTEGDIVAVTGYSKGRGFSGGVRRYGFKGGRKTHGQSDRHRAPGSIGAGTFPGRVIAGKRMAGHYGVERKTTRGLKLVKVDPEQNLLFIKGAVPGAKNGRILIRKQRVK